MEDVSLEHDQSNFVFPPKAYKEFRLTGMTAKVKVEIPLTMDSCKDFIDLYLQPY